MGADGTPIESIENWLSNKPFWEQFVWKINLEKDSLTDEDIEQCYQYLSEHLGLIEPFTGKRSVISFKNEIISIQEDPVNVKKIKIREVKDFIDVNALSENCSIKVGPNLTLAYGGNGSGKSGIGRLLGNACFSRGEREILPNIRTSSIPAPLAKATFILEDSSGSLIDVKYSFGDNNDYLKRFSVFDSQSVLIHLDQSNRVSFTPAQIKIFDKVADTITKLEEKLTIEKNAKRKNNPFQSMFLDGATSATANFCKSITGATKLEDFLKHADFDLTVDEAMMVDLKKQIDEKNKLDIPKRKSQLAADRQNLEAFKSSLQGIVNRFTVVKMNELNQLEKNILEKSAIVESLSVASFNDGIFKKIGSLEWKTLIRAAKVLYESELKANENNDPNHCMLCHQELSIESKNLFRKYWQFLESKAESELSQLAQRQSTLIQELRLVKAMFPKFLVTDAGVKVLHDEDPKYLEQLTGQFKSLENVLDSWITNINSLREVSCDNVPIVDLLKIDTIIASKVTEESKLIDPTADIAKLTAQLNSLNHKKEATTVKDAAIEYITFLHWSLKTDSISFPGIKMMTTKKRRESFLVGVAQNYKGVFNQELAKLDCEFNLVMNTSGDQGNTVKEYRLDFAEDYIPSQILSEGEQNACSLADFLTEVQLDKNNCGIILDDPVTSLDHERKDKIAKRLVEESGQRQVIVLTHDITFMSQLVRHASNSSTPVAAHWIRKVDGVPGCIDDNTSPRLSSLASLKNDSQEAVKDFATFGTKEQERALGVAFDYLRSASEALIEEVLFAGTIKRYEDHIKVTNLEEAIFDQVSALKIVDLHGKISEVILAHNRSDQQRENPPGLNELTVLRLEFDELETSLKASLKLARANRKLRKEEKEKKMVGW
jgi:hypothetical protein